MSRRILIVDDEAVIADSLAAILGRAGYQTETAYCAEEALSRCTAAHFDLVLSDVSMPGINGIEMAILIRQRHPHCRILLFSGRLSHSGLLADASMRGFDFDLLLKPVHPKDLLLEVADRFEAGSSVSDSDGQALAS